MPVYSYIIPIFFTGDGEFYEEMKVKKNIKTGTPGIFPNFCTETKPFTDYEYYCAFGFFGEFH